MRAALAHIALDDSAAGLADFGDRLAGREVIYLGNFQRVVGLTPADDGKIQHCNAKLSWCDGHVCFHLNPSAKFLD